MPAVVDIPRESSEAPGSPSKMLEALLFHANQQKATDIHIYQKGTCQVFFRREGRLKKAISWDGLTDGDGRLSLPGGYNEISRTLLKSSLSSSVVYRFASDQMRVQPLILKGREERLFIRIQPLRPPAFSSLVDPMPAVKAWLENPDGLILIGGPVGGGKTTLAASLTNHWSSSFERHIVTLEDPVEYLMNPEQGSVTQIETSLTDRVVMGETSLAQHATDILRCDLDGLFVGECRDRRGISLALASASADEGVVTTVQAGGFADAIIRVLNLYCEGGVSPEVARITLASCLHSVLYVNLSFDNKGKPVPVIMHLPVNSQRLRKIIAESKPEQLATALDAYIADNAKKSDALVNSDMAIANAARFGAIREHSIRAVRKVNALTLERAPA